MVSLLFLQGEKTKSYRTNVREMCSSSTLLKVRYIYFTDIYLFSHFVVYYLKNQQIESV
jgi:hypothetical protein